MYWNPLLALSTLNHAQKDPHDGISDSRQKMNAPNPNPNTPMAAGSIQLDRM